MRGRPRLESSSFLQMSGFISCLALTNVLLLFPGLTLQTHVEGAPFNLDSSGRPRLDLRALQGFRLSFVPGRLHGLPSHSCGPTLQMHVEHAPFNLDKSGFSMVFSYPTVCLGSPRSRRRRARQATRRSTPRLRRLPPCGRCKRQSVVSVSHGRSNGGTCGKER